MTDSIIKVTSNNRERKLVSVMELPYGIAVGWFDYMLDDGLDELNNPRFFRYRDNWYDVQQFERVIGPLLAEKGWQGHSAQSMFDAVLIRYPEDDTDHVVVAHATW